jgi:hypothetical protein
MMPAHLRVIQGGRSVFVTEAPPREWSQPLLPDLVERYRERLQDAEDRAASRMLWIVFLLYLLIGTNGIWFVLWLVRKGVID